MVTTPGLTRLYRSARSEGGEKIACGTSDMTVGAASVGAGASVARGTGVSNSGASEHASAAIVRTEMNSGIRFINIFLLSLRLLKIFGVLRVVQRDPSPPCSIS